MIDFIEGPLFYISVAVFVIGLITRAVMYVRGLSQKLDRVAYRSNLSVGLQGAAYSIFRWLIPGGTRGWRTQPLMAICFFCFHIGALTIPLFLLAHTVVIEYYFGISLPALPAGFADFAAILALIGLAGLAIRRVVVPEAKALTKGIDWLVLALVTAPFLTGAIARFCATAASYDMWMLLHILSAEIFMIAVPFTKLNHIILFFMTRGQIGMEFAIKRGGVTRGPVFPW